MEKPRFGDSFEIDATNRLNALKKIEGMPEYIEFGRDIREQLKKSVETEGWPECPRILENLEDLFEKAGNTVKERWLAGAQELITQKSVIWKQEIPQGDEYDDLRDALADPMDLEEQLHIRQFGVLEPLRKVIPEAWRDLIIASSERQLASIVLLRHWIAELSDDEINRMGVSRQEMELFVDAAAILGKYFDQAYVKQIELADMPGGSDATKLTEELGAERIYDIYTSEEHDSVSLKTYSDVFPFEWERIVKRFDALSDKVTILLQQNQLPHTYTGLPEYLKSLAKIYGSQQTDTKTLHAAWNKLEKETLELLMSGCPIVIVPQGTPSVAGEANKVDVEVRLGLRTKKNKGAEAVFNRFRKSAQKILEENKAKLEEEHETPPIFVVFQPFAFGPNLYWMTRAEAGGENIVAHTNAIADVAVSKEIPLLKNIFGEEIQAEVYKKAAITETVLHELAHTVMPEEDSAVHGRIGAGAEENVLEELKADTVAMMLLKENMEDPEIKENVITQFFAKIGTILDYLTSKSSKTGSGGERYYFTGIAQVSELLRERVIEEENGTYQLKDAQKGIEVLAAFGEEILKRFYADEQSTPGDVKEYIRDLREMQNDAMTNRFLEKIKMKKVH